MEDFEERGWEQSTTEHEGNEASQLFHKQGLENAKKAISSTFVDAQSERDSTTVVRTAESDPLEQVLALLKKGGKGVHDPDNQASEDTGADGKESSSLPKVTAEAVSDEYSDEGDISFALRLANASGKKVAPKPAAKPKPAANILPSGRQLRPKACPSFFCCRTWGGHGEDGQHAGAGRGEQDHISSRWTRESHQGDFEQACERFHTEVPCRMMPL